MPVTNQILNEKKDDDCFKVTREHKFFRSGDAIIKRSLRPTEWQTCPIKGTTHIPRLARERISNEAAALKLISHETDIPVPKVYACFADNEAAYIVMEYIEGVSMDELEKSQKDMVFAELLKHLDTMHTLRSRFAGGANGHAIVPSRVTEKCSSDSWNLRPAGCEDEPFHFCHNNLTQDNVIVDPKSLRIRAIIDWAYAGFWPIEFERWFFTRVGPPRAIKNEDSDARRLFLWLKSRHMKPAPGT